MRFAAFRCAATGRRNEGGILAPRDFVAAKREAVLAGLRDQRQRRSGAIAQKCPGRQVRKMRLAGLGVRRLCRRLCAAGRRSR